MRLSPMGAASHLPQLVLTGGETATEGLRPGDQLEGQVLRMVDNQAVVQVGEELLVLRSNVPLIPGQVVLQVESQSPGEWRLRLLSNEPAQHLVRDQISELRLQANPSRETLMRALLGKIVVDRETFLLAEQLWKGVERSGLWLESLVQLFKSNLAPSEEALRTIHFALQQREVPGWLAEQAQVIADYLIREWQLEATPPRLELLASLLMAASEFGEVDFSLTRWLTQVAWLHPVGELPEAASEREVTPPVTPEGVPGELPEATVATPSLETTLEAGNLAGRSNFTPPPVSASRLPNLSPAPGATVTTPEGATTSPPLPARGGTPLLNTPLDNLAVFFLSDAADLATIPESQVVKSVFSELEGIWQDTGNNREILPMLQRLFYAQLPVNGRTLLSMLAEQESRVHFAQIDWSEAEIGDKRAYLRQLSLGESPERLVLLQHLYRGQEERLTREGILQGERLWRSLGGQDKELDTISRLMTARLPLEVSSAWALQTVDEHSWQNAVLYMWLHIGNPPMVESHIISPEPQEDPSDSRDNSGAPLVLLGFQTQRFGPMLLTVTSGGNTSYRLQLTVHELWQKELEREAVRELLPRLRELLPQVRWQVLALKDQEPRGEKLPQVEVIRRRFDKRV
ncbi:MAG: hypothetical protein FWF06_04320 [Symbiobacteriaceae bacterium]|nr:hypothetical protein [Symbiobacteriaceae bacterium]